MSRPRALLLGLAALLVAGGLVLGASRPPRLSLTNDGLRLAYPPPPLAGALLALAGFATLAGAAPRLLIRAVAGLLALACAVSAADVAVYAVEVDTLGIRARDLGGRVEILWGDVARIDSRPDAVVVVGTPENLTIDTRGLREADRAALDRRLRRGLMDSTSLR